MFTPEEEEKYLQAFGSQNQFSLPKDSFVEQDFEIIELDTWGNNQSESSWDYVEYAYSNLSLSTQKLLLCLAEFSKFIDKSDIPNYIEQLKIFQPLHDYPFDKFSEAIQEAIRWGLLSPMDEDGRFLMIQPVLPDFLQSQLNNLDAEIHLSLRAGFKNHYQGLADSYQDLLDSEDEEEHELGLFFCRLEYENLDRALQICLENQESIGIYFCLDKYWELINDRQNSLKLAETVCQHLENYASEFIKGELGYQIAFAFSRLGIWQLEAMQYQQARKSYAKTLAIYDDLDGIEERQKQLWQAASYHQLGRVAQELQEFAQARRNYQQALDIFHKFGDRYECAGTYNQLGIVAQQLQEFAQARLNYQQALDIFNEFGDRYECARTYHLLGIVAQQLQEYEEARSHYQQALEINIAYSDRNSCARTYHNLGSVAQQLRDFAEAKRNYQQALEIKIASGDRNSCARTYFQLGRVAEELGALEEAKADYLQALQITTEFNDEHDLAISLNNLARFYQATQDESLLAAVSEICGVSIIEIVG